MLDEAEAFYDLCAPFYDGDYDGLGYDVDLDFYVGLAGASGGPVLEMGCGTGRVALAIARSGVEVVGLEISPAMLERLRAKLAGVAPEVARRIQLVHGDIREHQLGRLFPLVVAPFRVVQHLVTEADVDRFLGNAARHLSPGGELAFDVFQPDERMITAGPELHVDIEREDPETGEEIRRVSRAVHRPDEQTFDVHFEWLIGPPGEPVRTIDGGETTVRWFTRGDLERLLTGAGFEVVEIADDFGGERFGPGTEDYVVRARRV